ncbi:hypothetical protein [Methylosinus sp. PW1]|uniref:hypothetical protein n=1 Tax=Methylosinus sp. PW1 TaxID=107636 RepID=UPI00055DEFA0|nr:hypothetical protein [Methylosinus sp. PW1]
MSEQTISELDRLANRLLEASTRAFGINAAISHIVDHDDCLNRGTAALMDHFCDDLEKIANGIHDLVRASRPHSGAEEPSQ